MSFKFIQNILIPLLYLFHPGIFHVVINVDWKNECFNKAFSIQHAPGFCGSPAESGAKLGSTVDKCVGKGRGAGRPAPLAAASVRRRCP